jgi:hypothetical protein
VAAQYSGVVILPFLSTMTLFVLINTLIERLDIEITLWANCGCQDCDRRGVGAEYLESSGLEEAKIIAASDTVSTLCGAAFLSKKNVAHQPGAVMVHQNVALMPDLGLLARRLTMGQHDCYLPSLDRTYNRGFILDDDAVDIECCVAPTLRLCTTLKFRNVRLFVD